MNLDQYLDVHVRALNLRSSRAELIARNIANADTPGFKARDIDFERELQRSAQGQNAGRTVDPQLLYRTPLGTSLDGNTVELQMEQSAFAENAVRYQSTLTFLNSKLRGLMTAITGQ